MGSIMDAAMISNFEEFDDFRDQDGNIDFDALFSVYDVAEVYKMVDDARRGKMATVTNTANFGKNRISSGYNGTSLSYYRDGSGQLNYEEIFNFFDLDGEDGLYSICNDSTLRELGLPPRQIGDRAPRYPSDKIKMLGKGFNGSH